MTDKPRKKAGPVPIALPGTGAVLRWIRGLPVEGVAWRTFPGLGIRAGVDGCTPTVTQGPSGRYAWDIPRTSGGCLSPIGAHIYAEGDVDLDEASEIDADPWYAVSRILRAENDGKAPRHADIAVWEVLVDAADHVDRTTTAKRLSSDGSGRKARRIRHTHDVITRALLARTRPTTAVVGKQRLHPVA